MKKHTNKIHRRHNNLIPPSSLQHPPHLFNTNHAQPLHLIFKACFSPNHSTPIQNRKVTILTPTKSQSKYSTIIMILYACTNEKYLIPISVPILPHTTTQDSPYAHDSQIAPFVDKSGNATFMEAVERDGGRVGDYLLISHRLCTSYGGSSYWQYCNNNYCTMGCKIGLLHVRLINL